MDDIIANAWNTLGLLWRLMLIAIPVVTIGWALTRGRGADADAMAAARTELEARHVPPPQVNSNFPWS
ncbi:MAG: hypothetical protein ABR537_13875 [Gemmatimonadales bacterium]